MTLAHWCYWSAALFGVPEMLSRKTTSGSIDALAKRTPAEWTLRNSRQSS